MFKPIIATLALAAGTAALAQTVPAPDPAAATPAASAAEPAAAALPRCSAEVRDRCRQDERFARDVARPGGSRDNNAMAYPTSRAAERRTPRR
jgi:curli biogenesis system outer membrane secretion channel CsgG